MTMMMVKKMVMMVKKKMNIWLSSMLMKMLKKEKCKSHITLLKLMSDLD
eukprot:CAMPEP_0114347900 /NCGR_PEP_ID=MMETSP0101-20121206/14290_1 /TAXON_ID=38822 ORGANISM="Pteridomonas danica, Strain PT" /NCGR_SAMPLE_ID=MMETSP0101 /ASSEMBLY_ACC=CAM_ASM_000211 /LENGTH=48 /DNA_ID= /DNA_START= /DNA_END= /DNA_ORIENTATION=